MATAAASDCDSGAFCRNGEVAEYRSTPVGRRAPLERSRRAIWNLLHPTTQLFSVCAVAQSLKLLRKSQFFIILA